MHKFLIQEPDDHSTGFQDIGTNSFQVRQFPKYTVAAKKIGWVENQTRFSSSSSSRIKFLAQFKGFHPLLSPV